MNRKRFLALLLALASLLSLLGCGSSDKSTAELYAMDTYMDLTAYGRGGEKALSEIKTVIEDIDNLFSAQNEESEIYALNHAGGESYAVSADIISAVSSAQTISEETDGALSLTIYPISELWGFPSGDFRVPAQSEIDALLPYVDDTAVMLDTEDGTITLPENAEIDPGAVGKGYAAEKAREILEKRHVSAAILNLGASTILTWGEKPDGTDWHIAVQDPETEGAYAGILTLGEATVNTSGSYERYFSGEDGKRYWHILDPATGYPADTGLLSVTIVCDNALVGDALSTAGFVMGQEKLTELWRERGDFEFVLLTEDHEIILSEGIQEAFTPQGDYLNAEITVISAAG